MNVLKKNYNEIIDENLSYNFNKDILQIINNKDKYNYFTNYIFLVHRVHINIKMF